MCLFDVSARVPPADWCDASLQLLSRQPQQHCGGQSTVALLCPHAVHRGEKSAFAIDLFEILH